MSAPVRRMKKCADTRKSAMPANEGSARGSSVFVKRRMTSSLPNRPGGSEMPWMTASETVVPGGRASQFGEAICRGMEWAGIALDPAKNQVRGKEERISKVESNVQIWIVPTNEELIVGRQTETVLSAN